MQEARGQLWCSGWDGSHVDWVTEEVNKVPVLLNSRTKEGNRAVTGTLVK